MKNIFLIFTIMVLVSSLLVTNFAYGERNCGDNLVCVTTGDYVKFQNNLGGTLIEFEEEIAEDRIILKWTSYTQDGSFDFANQYILDRSLGIYTSPENSELAEYDLEFPFLFVLRTPIPPEFNQQEFCKKTQHNFDGMNRDVILCERIEDEGNIKTVVDTKTGVVFQFDINMGFLSTNQELLETNIFSSRDFTETRDKSTKESKNQSKIPDWVKNNAGWWAEGSIDDGSFISGIQYLVKEKIIEISESKTITQNSKEIPSWIKNNAKWWSEGLIKEDDFLQGIQYLVEQGIVNINDEQSN